MAQFDLNRAADTPIATLKLNEIVPKNWHRYPPPIAPSIPVYVPTIGYTGGVANQGAAADNNGEVGTINSTTAGRGQAWNTQAEKATALGTTIAADVGKSYEAGVRGAIEFFKDYPVAVGKPVSSDIPAAFRPSQLT